MQEIKFNIIGRNRISATVPYEEDFILKIKTIPGRKWNPIKKYWEIPFNDETNIILRKQFGNNFIFDITLKLFELEKELKIRKYSFETVKNYVYHNKKFLLHIKKLPEEVENSDIKNYLYYIVEKEKASATIINISINALKFYFANMLNRQFVYEIKRPKKDRKLPIVLSNEELLRIFKVVRNLKHKAILMLTYSSGLRVSDTVKIRIQDIDKERKVINIKSAKGRKDRTTILSNVFLQVYETYLQKYRPKFWLFEGQYPDTHISKRTIQKIFETAKEKAEIKKNCGIHSLRHTFSTNLLENGIDIRFIQELLGHASVKTTMIYTHVSKKNLQNIKSPLDNLKMDE